MKQCCTCKQNKNFCAFGNNKSTKDLLDAMCKECRKIRNILNKENNALIRKRHYDKNKKQILLKLQMDRNPNKLKRISEYNKKYRTNNLDKINNRRKERGDEFHCKRLAWNAKRRAGKLQATPRWLTKEQLDVILSFYKLAKEKAKTDNIKYHVDHIIPLNGENVCGLHVPWNLQILEEKANIIKGNKL